MKKTVFWIPLLLGVFSWSITAIKSGLMYAFGIGFWGPHGHDGVWHIALSNQLAKGSILLPIFAGETIRNYHIGFDLLLAFIYKITAIPISIIYFQIIPPVLALAIGILTYRFLSVWTGKQQAGLWGMFFVYFGGSFGWIVTLIKQGVIGGESIFWSQQALSTLINPPFALSLVLLLLGFHLLLQIVKKFQIYKAILLSLIFALVLQIKVYAGLLAIFALSILGLVQLIKEKEKRMLLISILTLIFSVVLFLPLNKSSGSLIIYKPFWFLENMMGGVDRIGWPKFFQAMIAYKLSGDWLKFLLAYSFAFFIFLVGNLGTRIAGFLLFFKKSNFNDPIFIFLSSVAAGGIIVPMLFIQKGTSWNTIQFFYYTLFVFALFSAYSMSQLTFFGKRWALVLSGVVVLLAVPSSIATLKHYLPTRPPAMIPQEEIEALNFLQDQKEGVVLTVPFNREKATKLSIQPPKPLYLYESTAYVSAFSKHITFLEDEVNLSIMDYPWKERKRQVEEFFKKPTAEFLKKNNISYLYLVNEFYQTGEILGLKRIFKNDKVSIYLVD